MIELKTLKDLEIDIDNTIMIDELKAEAIKWVKNYENIEDLENVVDFIEHFFNLTEEDLK